MSLPILDLFDHLHQWLDKLEISWPLHPRGEEQWMQQLNQLVMQQCIELEYRLSRLYRQQELQPAVWPLIRQALGYAALGLYEEAEQALKSQSCAREIPLVQLLLAVVLYEKEKYQESYRQLQGLHDQELAYPPLRLIIQHLVACIEARFGQHQQALSRFEQVFHIDPSNEEALFNQALCHYHLGNRQTARLILKNMAALHPEIPSFRRLLMHIESGGEG